MRKQAAEKKTRAQTRDSNEKKMEIQMEIKMIMRAQNSQMKIRWRNGETIAEKSENEDDCVSWR